jgi:hypothetical protein
MLDRESGRVINIGSMSVLIGDPFMAVYSVASVACRHLRLEQISPVLEVHAAVSGGD